MYDFIQSYTYSFFILHFEVFMMLAYRPDFTKLAYTT